MEARRPRVDAEDERELVVRPDTTSPHSFNWVTSGYPVGSTHTVQVRAWGWSDNHAQAPIPLLDDYVATSIRFEWLNQIPFPGDEKK